MSETQRTISSLSPAEWRPIRGFEALYEISNFGLIRRIGKSKGASVGRLKSTRKNRDGYLTVKLYDASNHHGYDKLVHVLVLETFVGPCPVGKESRHLDGDPSNARLTNLVWGTPVENAGDKRRHGTLLMGETHPLARLTKEEVESIRASTAPQTVIAVTFGISQTHVSDIRNFKRWAA